MLKGLSVKEFAGILLFVALLVGGIRIHSWFNEKPRSEALISEPQAVQSPPEKKAELSEVDAAHIARVAVGARLRDADSARWGEQFIGKKGVFCGDVNAKNAYGGYSGSQRYMTAGTQDSTFLESEVADFETVWRQMCR